MNSAGKFIISCSVTVAALFFIAGRASATNLLQNPGFESGLGGIGGPPSWQAFNGGNPTSVGNADGNGPSAPGTVSANQFIITQSISHGPTTLTLQQTTPNGSVSSGMLVHYSFDMLQRSSEANGTETVHIFDEDISNNVLGEPAGALQPAVPDATWHVVSGSFNTLPNTDHLEIQFVTFLAGDPFSQEDISIDNVVLDAPTVPEPTTVTLVVLGLFGIIASRRNRKE